MALYMEFLEIKHPLHRIFGRGMHEGKILFVYEDGTEDLMLDNCKL